MASKELKEEIKKAKMTNKRMKKLSQKTDALLGIKAMDIETAAFFVGDYTYVKTYRIDKRNLTTEEKELLLNVLINKWGKRVRISVINTRKESSVVQIYVLTVYFRAADYYNAGFEIEAFEQLMTKEIPFRIVSDSIQATFQMFDLVLKNVGDSAGYSDKNLYKENWYNLLFKERVPGLKLTEIMGSTDYAGIKDIAYEYLDGFLISIDLFALSEEERSQYHKYIQIRYNENDSFEEFIGACLRIGTDMPIDTVKEFNAALLLNGCRVFCNQDSQAALSIYSFGIKDSHNAKMMDVKSIVSIL